MITESHLRVLERVRSYSEFEIELVDLIGRSRYHELLAQGHSTREAILAELRKEIAEESKTPAKLLILGKDLASQSRQ